MRTRLLNIAMCLCLLSGCAGIEVGAVSNSSQPPAAGQAVIAGKIEYVVDGAVKPYGFLNKPTLLLIEQTSGRRLATPETDRDGFFRWSLPAGQYDIAAIYMGYGATGMPLFLGEETLMINGLTHLPYQVTATADDVRRLGTLRISTRTKRGSDIWGSRVHDTVENMHVIPDPLAPTQAFAPLDLSLRRAHRSGIR